MKSSTFFLLLSPETSLKGLQVFSLFALGYLLINLLQKLTLKKKLGFKILMYLIFLLVYLFFVIIILRF